MNPIFIFPLFGIQMVMVFVWFGLCIWVFSRLESQHPEKYVEIGRPSLFMRNNIENNLLFMRFLWKKEYEVLEDESLVKACRFMKGFFLTYLLMFALMITGLVTAKDSPQVDQPTISTDRK